jgi:hypothetical protein
MVLGLDCSNLEVQKLARFLCCSLVRLGLGDPLKLKFAPGKYGPYADNLRHLLDKLDGSYLHCEKRLADAGPLDQIWVESEQCEHVLEYLRSEPAAQYVAAVEETAELIDGFESPLGMEILATIDWMVRNGKCGFTVVSVRDGLAAWPGGKAAGDRKRRLFSDRLINLAIERLAHWHKTDPRYVRAAGEDE